MSMQRAKSATEMPDYLTLDNEFRLFVWALFRAGVLTIDQSKSALEFIRKVRVEEIPLKKGLEECQEIEAGVQPVAQEPSGTDSARNEGNLRRSL